MNRKTILLLVTTAMLAVVPSADANDQERRSGTRSDAREIRDLLEDIEDGADDFRGSLDRALDESRLNGSRREDEINKFVKEFERATDRLRSRIDDTTAAREVLRRGEAIDNFMRRNRLSSSAERDWADLRRDLDRLSRRYNIDTRWERDRSDRRGRDGRRNRDRRD